ncbi:metallophosphoesterase family protein [Halocatena pleomorpha]|uniref:Phosphoesterase n=1 Tax=Halocatena pleomorpha TaxID=1785090 RepID=A0A3P3RED1_9EURY|nr:metallophosphoesterase family protein [Halocatena pleomorpha]RRJ31279.1 metallophosphoesterase [Halocatena pleomorpha]
MRLGVISDIHANRIALDAVLEAMPPVDRLACAGDVIGYNPQPAECVEIVRGEMPCVQGNHDRAVDAPGRYRSNKSAYEGLRYAANQLDAEQREWLQSLPLDTTLCNGRVRMVHSHPTHRGQYVRPPEFPALEPHLGKESVLILGHTHVQHHEMVDGTLIVNPGSVGQPRDRDPRAAFAVIDPDAQTVEEHRVSYDIERVQAAIESAGLPSWTGTRLKRGR